MRARGWAGRRLHLSIAITLRAAQPPAGNDLRCPDRRRIAHDQRRRYFLHFAIVFKSSARSSTVGR